MTKLAPAFFTPLWRLVIFVLALSGLAQMPIFKRYYIADLPGLGWLADYSLTHKMHYVSAALLLGIAAFVVTRWIGRLHRDWTLTGSGVVRLWMLTGIIGTGIIRMYKNQPGVSFSPEFTMVVDWAHLGLVMALGVLALAARLWRRGRYAVRRDRMA